MAQGKRSEKVADLIRREISAMLVRSIKDPRIGFVTITRVMVSDDCRSAKVYFSVAGTAEERERSTEGLESATSFVRKELGRRMRLRYTPDISFHFDPSIEYSVYIGGVIEQLKGESEKDED
jgi:ribosome-binding factor A